MRLNLCAVLALAAFVKAFIPCRPTNDSSLISTSNDFVRLSWRASSSRQGVYQDDVSRQLIADTTPPGFQYAARGAVVGFDEQNITQQLGTTAPFIALIDCDKNATDASELDDIFTLARDKGGVAALLYSTTSAACIMNQEYLDNFEKPIDIYSTRSIQSARLILSQFLNVDPSSRAYDSGLLNSSSELIWNELNQTLQLDPAAQTTAQAEQAAQLLPHLDPEHTVSLTRRQSNQTNQEISYLIAVLANKAGDFIQGNSTETNQDQTNNQQGNNDQGTGLAMIVLYAVTGCVSLLFVVVVVSGAIKALRHPERYGPRAARGANNSGQTRARGLSLAILDTFTVQKFRREGSSAPEGAIPKGQDNMEMHDVEMGQASSHLPAPVPFPGESEPADIGKEVEDTSSGCPICVEDFQEGEDLRVLPCAGQHKFHKDCIDPWLLGESSLCPLCRIDLSAQDGQLEGHAATASGSTGTTTLGRKFKRYVMQRRRRSESD